MAINYTITEVDGDLITVTFEGGSWAQVRVSADMTQEAVDDLVFQFAPKPVGPAPAFLTPGQARKAAPIPAPAPVVLTPEEELAQERESMVCSPLQGRLALRQVQMLKPVEAVVAESDEITKEAFQYATEWHRNSPLILSLVNNPVINMTEEQMDDLFRAAMAIKV